MKRLILLFLMAASCGAAPSFSTNVGGIKLSPWTTTTNPAVAMTNLVKGYSGGYTGAFVGTFTGDGQYVTNLDSGFIYWEATDYDFAGAHVTNLSVVVSGITNTGSYYGTDGNIAVGGSVSAASGLYKAGIETLYGNSSLNADNLLSGTVANARLPENVVTNGQSTAVTLSNALTIQHASGVTASKVYVANNIGMQSFSTGPDFFDNGGRAISFNGGDFYPRTGSSTYNLGKAGNAWQNVILSGTLTATNGVVQQVKPSFTTNFTCTTNLQTYCCNGTNQLVTLPNAAYVPNVIYRFTSTNGYGSYIVTNATGTQTIRDGVSLSHKQIGIAPFVVFSDGAQWWLAAKDQTVEPNAQFSCSTNIPLTAANTAYPVTFNSTDFNNSQGIALLAGTNGLNSKMWITNAGQYEFTPSIVFTMGAVSHTLRYWFRSNGTNIPASCTPVKISGNDTLVVTVPFVINITTPTPIEIWAESDGTGDTIAAGSASGNYPAAPSVICPVKRISDPWP